MRRTRRRGVFASVVAALVCSTVGGAVRASSPSWAVTPSRNPAGANKSELLSVSCPSATFCVAAGDSTYVHRESLVERWNGGAWAVMQSRNPVGSTFATLRGVSCPNTTSCIAVGGSSTSGIDETLIEHWDGRRWAIMPSPSPGARLGTQIDLSAVSCPTTTSCVAVGGVSTFGIGKPVIEHWNGTYWTVMTAADPPGPTAVNLLSVSCPSPTSCVAVGSFGDPRNHISSSPLVEHWNGRGGWSIMTADTPAPYTQLLGVTCPSTTSCFAVGSFSSIVDFGSLVEHWNGRGGWTATYPSLLSTLADVSCASTAKCFAVSNESSDFEYWNGTSWSDVTMNHPPINPALNAVSCPSTSRCFAVGRTRHHTTLVERYA